MFSRPSFVPTLANFPTIKEETSQNLNQSLNHNNNNSNFQPNHQNRNGQEISNSNHFTKTAVNAEQPHIHNKTQPEQSTPNSKLQPEEEITTDTSYYSKILSPFKSLKFGSAVTSPVKTVPPNNLDLNQTAPIQNTEDPSRNNSFLLGFGGCNSENKNYEILFHIHDLLYTYLACKIIDINYIKTLRTYTTKIREIKKTFLRAFWVLALFGL